MTVQDILEWIGLSSAGGVIGFIGGKRKSDAETRSVEIDNEGKIRHGYEELIESLRHDRLRLMEEYDKRIVDLETFYNRKIELMQQTWDAERANLEARVLSLEVEINRLKKS